MKIVVLDGHTLNPDDLSWKPLEALGDLYIYPRTNSSEVVQRASGAEVILVNKVQITAPLIDQLEELKYIGICATGYDNVDVAHATKRGIVVTNIPSYGTASVAQHTFALILELTNRVGLHNRSVKALEWVRNEDFSYFKAPLTELFNKKLGILGYGKIGQQVARIARSFDMEVLVYSSHAREVDQARMVDLQHLFAESDILAIHGALNDNTKGIVNEDMISTMKPSAFIINTSRGAIINEQHLANALNNNTIAGAALDVLSKEPPEQTNPLLSAQNCIITPHIAWVSREARQRLMDIVIKNVEGYLTGHLTNTINI